MLHSPLDTTLSPGYYTLPWVLHSYLDATLSLWMLHSPPECYTLPLNATLSLLTLHSLPEMPHSPYGYYSLPLDTTFLLDIDTTVSSSMIFYHT